MSGGPDFEPAAWLSEFNASTGEFTGRSFDGAAGLTDLAAMLQPGHDLMPGIFDHLSQRVDVATGLVVDFQPEAPADDALRTWVWSPQARRYLAVPTLLGRKTPVLEQLQQQMAQLEAAEQGRPMRELLLALMAGGPPDPEALARLQAAEQALAGLRSKHQALQACASVEALEALLASWAAG